MKVYGIALSSLKDIYMLLHACMHVCMLLSFILGYDVLCALMLTSQRLVQP